MCTPACCHWCGDQQVPRCVTGNARCHITSLSLRLNLTISNGYGEPIPPVAIHRIFPAGKSLPLLYRQSTHGHLLDRRAPPMHQFCGQSFRTGGYLLAGSQCTRRDLNPHSVEMDPKSTASAYSATDAEGGAVSCPLFLTFLYEPEFPGSWFLFLLSMAKPRIIP